MIRYLFVYDNYEVIEYETNRKFCTLYDIFYGTEFNTLLTNNEFGGKHVEISEDTFYMLITLKNILKNIAKNELLEVKDLINKKKNNTKANGKYYLFIFLDNISLFKEVDNETEKMYSFKSKTTSFVKKSKDRITVELTYDEYKRMLRKWNIIAKYKRKIKERVDTIMSNEKILH